ncbi:Permease of the drug/metabolite transporter (DMT) superfamily [Cystobacter fuscus DSM 2262]|uniref:Permease of the drug/metabolite transporter (DMT) superfamily n=1 Tax=Cystobacter fuscus (strain ATCC 25194 / DSM 2262 / NBRC 100088 / M29) TaxID=1242864 RepID=S9QA77_CYSF2|nr:DMT family transporter [Cystobacter fuscus]EPX58229.1 Permease of the drug/metabolite transporter (DMT) superfamily [Cystobacter fuscus DSM 2262]
MAMSTETKSLWLGSIGVLTFALTLPMTRMATGSALEPALSPWFASFGRAAFAGLLSVVYLLATRAPRPTREDAVPLVCAAVGNGLAWPILLALGLRYVESVHASVITGILPLATAALAALVFRRRPSLGFWFFAILGAALVVTFAWLRGAGVSVAGVSVHWADSLLVLAVLSAAFGYAFGAKLSQRWKGEHVICWMLVLLLPISVPCTLANWPQSPIPLSAWGGFFYISVFSMWLGMFVWYRALAMGDAVRVSQLQLAQPFLSILLSAPLLGEKLDPMTLVFGLAVIVTVFFAKRMPTQTSVAPPAVAASRA